jgi:hypothetical protein
MQTSREPYVAALCFAVVLLVTYACRAMAGDRKASGTLQVRSIELLTEGGERAATLGVREGSVVLELIGVEGAGLVLTAGKDSASLVIQRDGESRVVLSEADGGAYISLESASTGESDGSSLLLAAGPHHGEDQVASKAEAWVAAEAGDSVTVLGASTDDAGLSMTWNDCVEASIGAREGDAQMKLTFGKPVREPEGGHEVVVTASETGVELEGVED